MSNCQQLFEINKRINQIKRNMQSRQEKANQWSVPYQKILNKPVIMHNTQPCFRNTHSDKFHQKQEETQMNFTSKTQRRIFFQNKAKQSRKKINQFHNELKQLQQLQQLKTKLYIHKQHFQQANNNKEDPINYDKSSKPQLKTLSKLLNNAMMNSAGTTIGKQIIHKNTVRTLKDRVNPFYGLKVEKIIELYQEGKYSGKQNVMNQILGMGIQFTPYSTLKKDVKKDQENDSKPFGQNASSINQIPSTQRADLMNGKRIKSKNLTKTLNLKLSQKKDIYLEPIEKQQLDQSCSRIQLNIFQQRMKKLIEETTKFEQCEGNYVQMLRKCRNKQKSAFLRSSIGKVQANRTYKAIFDEK